MTVAAKSLRNFSVQIASLAISLVDRVVLTGLLIRSWGVELFSDWATIMSAVTLLVIVDFGFQNYLGNQLTKAEARRRPRAFQRLVSQGVFFYLVMASVLLVASIFILLLANFGDLLNLHSDDWEPAVAILALWMILRITRSSITQIYRGKGEYHRYIWADVRATVAGTLIGVAAVLAGAGPLVVAFGFLGGEIVFGTGWALIHVPRRYRSIRIGPRRPSGRAVRETGGALRWYGTFATVSNLMQNAPIIIIAALGLGGPMLVAFFLQRTLVNLARTISSNITMATTVEIAGQSAAGASSVSEGGLVVLARANAGLAALATTGLLVFGPDVVELWTGRRELGSLAILGWLLLPAVVLAPAIPLQFFSFFADRLQHQAAALAVYAALGIGGAVMLGQHFGVVGVAAALGVAECAAIGVLGAWLASRDLGIRYRRLVAASALTFTLVLIWSGAIGIAISSVSLPSSDLFKGGRIIAWTLLAGLPAAWLCLPARFRIGIAGWRPASRAGR